MTTDQYPSEVDYEADLIARHKQAAMTCIERSERFRQAATDLAEQTERIRGIGFSYLDPEDPDEYTAPKLTQHVDVELRHNLDHLERVAFQLHGMAGIWGAEAEEHTNRVTSLTAGADGAP